MHIFFFVRKFFTIFFLSLNYCNGILAISHKYNIDTKIEKKNKQTNKRNL